MAASMSWRCSEFWARVDDADAEAELLAGFPFLGIQLVQDYAFRVLVAPIKRQDRRGHSGGPRCARPHPTALVPTLLRGNAVCDAPRGPRDEARYAERPGRRSHGDRGSEWDALGFERMRAERNRPRMSDVPARLRRDLILTHDLWRLSVAPFNFSSAGV